MYKHILVPVVFDDGHDTQASYQAALKLADEATRFTVVHVLEDIPNYVTTEIPAETMESARLDIEKKLHASATALEGAKAVLVHGDPGRSIVEYAKDHDVDCIVMASHQLGFTDIFLGSTATRVVRHAKCSVHVIR